MSRAQHIARTFVELADTLVEDFDVIDFLHQTTLRCQELLDITDAAVLLAHPPPHLHSPAPCDPSPALQHVLDTACRQGPALDAHRTLQPVTPIGPDDMAARWPQFASALQHAGHTLATAVPMRLRKDTIGALLLLHTGTQPLNADDLALAQALTDAATIGLIHALDGAYQAGGHGDQRRVADPACELHDSVVHFDADRRRRGGEQVGDHFSTGLLGDLLVAAQEHLEQIGSADDALQHAQLVHHRQPFDLGVRHGAGGLARVASERVVSAGEVISSSAVTAPAFARSLRRRNRVHRSGSLSRNSSLGSRSASETTPTTRPSPSRTGRALAFRSCISCTISLKVALRPTAATVWVMTSLTMCGVPCMIAPRVQM